jgi:putative ABC transport system permease protein
MSTFWQDVRYSLRMLRRGRWFTVIAVLTLALGIGAGSAILTLIRSVILNPLPYRDPARLVRLYESLPKFGWTYFTFSWPDYVDFRARNRGFEAVGACIPGNFNLMLKDRPEMVRGARANSSFWQALGIAPQRGRTFTSEDDRGPGAPLVVLSDALWQRLFARDPEIVGKPITVNDRPFTVAGVMPVGFELSGHEEIWLTLGPDTADNGRGNHGITVVGRLKSGVSLAAATEDAKAVSAQLEKDHPGSNEGESILLVSITDWLVAKDFRRALWLLAGAVAFLLLIACSNVANLLLARASERRTEMAVRSALGARPMRLARQLLTESAMLSLLGGGLGAIVGAWCVAALKAFGGNSIPRLQHVSPDVAVFAATILIALLCGLTFGLAPAFRAARTDLNSDLKLSGRACAASRGKDLLRSLLVVSEVALSLVLLAGAGLLIRSYWLAVSINPGFPAQNLLTARFNVPRARYADPDQAIALLARVNARARALPGVQQAGFTDYAPFHDGNPSMEVYLEGRPATSANEPASSGYRDVSPGYLEALGVPLLSGRTFTDRDSLPSAPIVVVVSRAWTNRFFPGQDAVGRQFHPGDPAAKALTIIGVVGDAAYSNIEELPGPLMYFPPQNQGYQAATFVVRSTAPTDQVVAALRDALRAEDPTLPLYGVQQMDALISTSLTGRKFNLLLLGSFAGLALLLAIGGVFGVVSYNISQRTQEIGIRMALGAQPRDILHLMLGQGMLPVVAGLGLGLAGALLLTRLLSGFLYAIPAHDPATYAGVAILFILIALVACALPARRAARLDPNAALRNE